MVAAGVPSSSQTMKVSQARMLRSMPLAMAIRSSLGHGLVHLVNRYLIFERES
jgi:hypothetical protein